MIFCSLKVCLKRERERERLRQEIETGESECVRQREEMRKRK